MKKYLPPLILFFLLLIGWQALALGINAAYILPTPIQVIQISVNFINFLLKRRRLKELSIYDRPFSLPTSRSGT